MGRRRLSQADFIWQDHICCSHAKWHQVVTVLEPDITMYCVDVVAGPYQEMNDHKIKYVVDQLCTLLTLGGIKNDYRRG